MTCLNSQTRIQSSFVNAVVCLSGLFVVAGCNRHPDRAAVAGEVKMADGRPIESGMIEFSGLDQTLVTGATITAGKYQVPRAKGLKVGKYRICINAPDRQPDPAAAAGFPGEFRSRLPKELIPPRYNRDSQIEVAVPDTNDQRFDFTIETK
jgi:hypothetical protein